MTAGLLNTNDQSHQPTQDSAYTFVVTSSQAARLLDVAAYLQAHTGTYNLPFNNCLSVCHALISSAGVAIPPLPHAEPLRSWGAWKTGDPSPSRDIHDPAVYNEILKNSATGRDARARYDRTTSLHGTETGCTPHELRQEAHADSAAESLHPGSHSFNSPDHPTGRHSRDEDHDVDDQEDAEVVTADDTSNFDAAADPGLSVIASGESRRDDDPGESSDSADMKIDHGLSTAPAPDDDPGLSCSIDQHLAPFGHGAANEADIPYEPPPFHPT